MYQKKNMQQNINIYSKYSNQHPAMRSILAICLTPFLIMLLWSCSTKTNHCDVSFIPKVTTNTSVLAGDTLQLHVNRPSDVNLYNWYGPNGFSSHDSAPAIPGLSSVNAGRYHVDIITNGGCIYSAVSDSIQVNAPIIPCSPGGNTGSISGIQDISFYYVSSGPNGGTWAINANGSGGDLSVTFFGNTKPGVGIYSIQGGGGLSGPGYVQVSFTASSSLWNASSGTVYVAVNNGKITATCCTTNLYSGTWNISTTGSFQVTEP